MKYIEKWKQESVRMAREEAEELRCCANCRHSVSGEQDSGENCGHCHLME